MHTYRYHHWARIVWPPFMLSRLQRDRIACRLSLYLLSFAAIAMGALGDVTG